MGRLIVSLAPYEKVLVGGALMQNGPKKASLRILGDTWVLRLSDAMHPDDARTPLTRCYAAAQGLLTGAAADASVLMRLLSDARSGFEGFAFAGDLRAAMADAEAGAWFRVMRRLKPLLPQEAAILADPRFRAPETPDEPICCGVLSAHAGRAALTAK